MNTWPDGVMFTRGSNSGCALAFTCGEKAERRRMTGTELGGEYLTAIRWFVEHDLEHEEFCLANTPDGETAGPCDCVRGICVELLAHIAALTSSRDALREEIERSRKALHPAEQEGSETCPGCGGDAGDNWFDRSICACGAMHTCCAKCGRALDGCEYEQEGGQDG